MPSITRRRFLQLGGVAAAMLPAASALPASPLRQVGPRIVYRLSLRGRRGSRAGKYHNANYRFATIEAADRNRAHPGDNSRIVPITVSQSEYGRLFPAGIGDGGVADLRIVNQPAAAGDSWRRYE